MGSYIRKSFKFGPFRFNLSKSGIGVSAGIKGARIGMRPNGRAYTHVGRYGLYHRQELGSFQNQREEENVTSKGNFICSVCGSIGKPIRIIKGSFLIELALWLFFILPGLVYSLWRLTSKYEACPQCKSSLMIPLSSPVAQKLLSELQPKKPAESEPKVIKKSTSEISNLAADYINKMTSKK